MVNTILHIIPDNDLVDHEPTRDCVCGPATDITHGDDGEQQWIITHHALDNREQQSGY